VTRAVLLAQICTKSFVGWGFAPDPTGGAYSAPPDPLDGLGGGATREKERREGRGKERRGGKGKGGDGVPESRVGKPSVGNWASPFRYQHGLAHRQASPFPCKNGIVRSLGRRSMLYRCCSAAAGASNDSAAAADLRQLSSSSSSSLAF